MKPETIGIIAVTVSAFSLLISGLSLGWNIYRDVLLKPRLKVRVSISFIKHGEYESENYIFIYATNHGPGEIVCNSIAMAKLSILRFLGINWFNKYAHVMYDYTNQYSSELPKKLGIGETIQLPIPCSQDAYLSVNPTHVGIMDSYDKCHWASKTSLKGAKRSYFKKFQKRPWGA